jgi:hypothetical protein
MPHRACGSPVHMPHTLLQLLLLLPSVPQQLPCCWGFVGAPLHNNRDLHCSCSCSCLRRLPLLCWGPLLLRWVCTLTLLPVPSLLLLLLLLLLCWGPLLHPYAAAGAFSAAAAAPGSLKPSASTTGWQRSHSSGCSADI